MNFPDHFKWLFENGPSIPIYDAHENIEILTSPSHFHQTMINQAKNVSKRIKLSTLYLGNDPPTKILVDAIFANLRKSNKNSETEKSKTGLTFEIVCDYARGNRNSDSTRGAILPIKKEFPDKVKLSMYSTPAIGNTVNNYFPSILKETIGVQHSKIYLFDDNVILSGANLSQIYFTNRTDRYILFKNQPILCDFLCQFLEKMQKLSIDIDENDKEIVNSYHPVSSDRIQFMEFAQKLFEPLFMPKRWGGDQKFSHSSSPEASENSTTWLFPTFQAKQLGITHDSETIIKLLKNTFDYNSKIHISTGYFNLAREVQDAVLDSKCSEIKILCAADEANGFYKAKGLMGRIPDMYNLIGSDFYQMIRKCQMEDIVNLFEYKREGWSFHSKGIWYSEREEKEQFTEQDSNNSTSSTSNSNSNSNSKLFVCNVFGSSNFGFRSFHRDTELQMTLVTCRGSTDSHILKSKFDEERRRIFDKNYIKAVDDNRQKEMCADIPTWVRYFSLFAKNYL